MAWKLVAGVMFAIGLALGTDISFEYSAAIAIIPAAAGIALLLLA